MTKTTRFLALVLAAALLLAGAPLSASAATPLPNFKATAEGIVTWDHVPGADYYSIMGLSAGGIPIRQNPSGSVDQACTNWTAQGVTYDFRKYADLNGKYKAGTYNITISAVRNHTTMGFESTFQFQYSTAQTALDKVKGLAWDGMTARWDAVLNATAYIVDLYDTNSGSQKSLKNVIVTDTE